MEPDEVEDIAQRMHALAREQHNHRIAFENVKATPHRAILDRAILNVLSTDLAIFTYAQIIDGLPTADVAYDRRYSGMYPDHIIDEVHKEVCSGAMRKAREFHKTWDPSILMFNPHVVKTYQQTKPDSKMFKLRLIELVAVALHQIGALLFDLDFRLHDGDVDNIVNWKPDGDPGDSLLGRTFFVHGKYQDSDIYPEGMADVVGYWAEDRILGGVCLFDRNDSKPTYTDADLPNIYFHSCRDKVTFRIYQLRDDQQDALTDFLLADAPSENSSPLPILGDKQNRVRVDDLFAIVREKIYRDLWERRPATNEERRFMERRPHDEIDYPEIRDEIFRINAQLGIPLPPKAARTPSPPMDG